MDPTSKGILGFLQFISSCVSDTLPGPDPSLVLDSLLFIQWTLNGAFNEKLSFYKCPVIK